MWYAGIDWANDHHDALVIDETGRQVGAIARRAQPARHEQTEHVLGADQWLGVERTDGLHHRDDPWVVDHSPVGGWLAGLSGQSAHRRSSAIRIGSQDRYD